MSKERQAFIDAAYNRAFDMGLDHDEADQFVKESVEGAEARGDL
jgi:hypothetical protein